MTDFVCALTEGDIASVRTAEKAEYHNHIHLGARANDLIHAGIHLPEIKKHYGGLDDMNVTVSMLLNASDTTENHLIFWRAALANAAENGVIKLSPSFGNCLREFFGGSFCDGYKAFCALRDEVAPGMQLFPEQAFKRGKDPVELEHQLDSIIESGVFHSIDFIGPEDYPVAEYAHLFKRAHRAGLICRAHVGEFSSPETIKEHLELLELDEIHHGITAIRSPYVMDMLKERGTVLHICPISNVCTGAVSSIQEHPVGKLYRHGIPVTIGSDDCLLFGNTLAEEYLTLYQRGVLSADELDCLRLSALGLYNGFSTRSNATI